MVRRRRRVALPYTNPTLTKTINIKSKTDNNCYLDIKVPKSSKRFIGKLFLMDFVKQKIGSIGVVLVKGLFHLSRFKQRYQRNYTVSSKQIGLSYLL